MQHETSEQFCRTKKFNNFDCTFSELDRDISKTEVTAAIKHLKHNKAAGSDLW